MDAKADRSVCIYAIESLGVGKCYFGESWETETAVELLLKTNISTSKNSLVVGDEMLMFAFGKQQCAANHTKLCMHIPSVTSFYSLRLDSMQGNNSHCSQMEGEVVSQSFPLFLMVNQTNSKHWHREFPAFLLVLVGILISEDVFWVKQPCGRATSTMWRAIEAKTLNGR